MSAGAMYKPCPPAATGVSRLAEIAHHVARATTPRGAILLRRTPTKMSDASPIHTTDATVLNMPTLPKPNDNHEPRGEMRLKKSAFVSPRRLDRFGGLQQLANETLRFARTCVIADGNYDKSSGLEEVKGRIQGEKLSYFL